MNEVEAALVRVQAQLGPQDYELFRRLVNTLMAVIGILNSQRALVSRLRRLFGLSSSEKSRDLLKAKGTDANAAAADAAASAAAVPNPSTTDAESPSTPATASEGEPEPEKRKGHGRLGASVYQAAEHITVPHASLAVGTTCPDCQRGKLYELKEPARYLRIFGQPLLSGTCWDCQRLRCSGCGAVHTAKPPPEACGPKFDDTAVAMLALCRYSLGLPHHRLQGMQEHMKLPVPASTQWDLLRDHAPAFEPIFSEFERQAAQGEVIHNDDSYARLLAFMGERRAKLLQAAQFPDPERVGLFTTAIMSIHDEQPIALFYTGRKYAGENLADLLQARDKGSPPPVHMCDGLDSRNHPKGRVVLSSNCATHARRGFVDQVVNFPSECRYVLEQLREVYRIEARCKKERLTKEQRLASHQEHSAPIMQALKERLESDLRQKRVEPNSDLGRAYNYMLKRWEKLTLFLRVPGAPIDNNICERALKMAIRHRRNSLFYRSERGAEIGDMFMSLIHTAKLRGENPFDYLIAVLRNEKAAAENPADWLPWTYQATLARMVSPAALA